jgi:hypothetical protein
MSACIETSFVTAFLTLLRCCGANRQFNGGCLFENLDQLMGEVNQRPEERQGHSCDSNNRLACLSRMAIQKAGCFIDSGVHAGLETPASNGPMPCLAGFRVHDEGSPLSGTLTVIKRQTFINVQ